MSYRWNPNSGWPLPKRPILRPPVPPPQSVPRWCRQRRKGVPEKGSPAAESLAFNV